jgi:SM-20-related protein
MTEVMAVKSTSELGILDLGKLRSATLRTDPFDYILVSGFLGPDWYDRLMRHYPPITKGGSFPLSTLKCGQDFSLLIQALDGREFREIVEDKFSVQLAGRPTMFTVRGQCRQKDGKIHTDTESKIITVLLYMNRMWAPSGGRLRLLNSGADIDDVAIEIAPIFGTMLIFKRCNHSFHGHLPFEGERRVIQMNWVTEQKFVDREIRRHQWSALLKKLRFS